MQCTFYKKNAVYIIYTTSYGNSAVKPRETTQRNSNVITLCRILYGYDWHKKYETTITSHPLQFLPLKYM